MDEETSPKPRPRARHLARAAWFCLPVIVWLVVIALASTDIGSEVHTGSVLERLLDWIFGWEPGPSDAEFSLLSLVVRKLAHFVEYTVLALLLSWTLWGLHPGWGAARPGTSGGETLRRLALVVLPLGVVVAATDEFHQTFVASRTGSPGDALIDVAGLVVGLGAAWLILRRRRAKHNHEI
ncbi:MAG: VanZ family protein [Thermoleophilia bacterium]|nr:VanZ family protein [Thermoleophilia bacterium]